VDAFRQIRGFWSYLICFITLKVNNLVVLMASLSNFSYHGLFSRAYTAIRAAAVAQPPQPPPPPPVVPGPSSVPPSTAIPAAVDVNWSNESK
jgi:zona occludens toxin (predicted ATPase)